MSNKCAYVVTKPNSSAAKATSSEYTSKTATTVGVATRAQTEDVHDFQCSKSAHPSDEWNKGKKKKKKN